MPRYPVLAYRNAGFDAACIEPHRAFLQRLCEQGMLEMSCGFSDGSGGACLLIVPELATAQAVVADDPVATTASSDLLLHEWNAIPALTAG